MSGECSLVYECPLVSQFVAVSVIVLYYSGKQRRRERASLH